VSASACLPKSLGPCALEATNPAFEPKSSARSLGVWDPVEADLIEDSVRGIRANLRNGLGTHRKVKPGAAVSAPGTYEWSVTIRR
jgi:hypothetical protein